MRREDTRAALIIMGGLVAATLTGFLREAALAYQLGVGRATDIYLIAFTVPEFVFTALPIVLLPALIPIFGGLRLQRGEIVAWRFGLRAGGWLLGLLLVLTGALALASPLYVRWLAPGFDVQEQSEAARAARLMLPSLCLMGAAMWAGAILQAYRRFARPALATAVYNLAFVTALLGLPLSWLVGRAAWGVSLGAAAALLLQVPLLLAFRPRGTATVPAEPTPASTAAADGRVREMFRLAAPLAVGYAVHHAIYFVDRAMATTVATGGVAILNYAYRLALVVGQLSGLAVSTALFPRMAEQATEEDWAGLRDSLQGALRFVWMVGLPACGALVVLRHPLVEVLFQRGAFSAASTAAVGDVLVWYAVAILADALCQPLWRVVYARRRPWTVLSVNGLQTGVRIACNVALIQPFGYNGLALSAAVGLSVQALVLACLVRRWLGVYLTRGWWHAAARVALAAGLALLVVSVVMSRWDAGPAPILLGVCSASGALTYLVALHLLRRAQRSR